jgi:hypothetical protein
MKFAWVLLLFACNTANKKGFYFDYESVQGWSVIRVVNGISPAGKWCHQVAPDQEYSHTFSLNLATANPNNAKRLKIAAINYAPNFQAPVFLVVQLLDPNNGTKLGYWQIAITDNAAVGKTWQPINQTIDLPANAQGNSICKVFFWNQNKQLFYVDDFNIVFE